MTLATARLIFRTFAMKGPIESRVYRRGMRQEMEQAEIAECRKAARRWIDAGVVSPSA